MTPQQKRRARDAKHRQAQLEQKHREEIGAAAGIARSEGFKAGAQHGANAIRSLVLDHAGRLYKERKDTDAAAVREVHRLLPTSV